MPEDSPRRPEPSRSVRFAGVPAPEEPPAPAAMSFASTEYTRPPTDDSLTPLDRESGALVGIPLGALPIGQQCRGQETQRVRSLGEIPRKHQGAFDATGAVGLLLMNDAGPLRRVRRAGLTVINLDIYLLIAGKTGEIKPDGVPRFEDLGGYGRARPRGVDPGARRGKRLAGGGSPHPQPQGRDECTERETPESTLNDGHDLFPFFRGLHR